ncbi:hypothetical protein RF11_01777 [Thelohanellus kitauei]|uniref:Uncharacterized protein n=1 Tax=Thelohanellus kitauei TaxID=669202 RepID=A0A0C2MU96_THEKT|nr:hypothetical protein RF11_01777 [Thelohanellus kitauei]
MKFLRRTGLGDIDAMAYRYSLWASNDGFSTLRMESQIFIYTALKVTLNPFFRCLILHQIKVLTKKWDPKIIGIDLEKIRMNSVKYQCIKQLYSCLLFSFKASHFSKNGKKCAFRIKNIKYATR